MRAAECTTPPEVPLRPAQERLGRLPTREVVVPDLDALLDELENAAGG